MDGCGILHDGDALYAMDAGLPTEGGVDGVALDFEDGLSEAILALAASHVLDRDRLELPAFAGGQPAVERHQQRRKVRRFHAPYPRLDLH